MRAWGSVVVTLGAAIASCAASGCAGPLAHVATEERWLAPSTGKASVAVPPRALKDGEALRIAIYGDTRGNRPVHRLVVNAMAAAHPDLVIFTGDALACLPVGHMPDLGLATYFVPFWPQVQRGYPWATLSSVVPFPALVHESIGSAVAATRDPDGFNGFLADTAPLRVRDRVPLLFAPGNHDLYHQADRIEATRLFGEEERLYRALDVAGRFRFVVLDTGSDLFGSRDPMPVGGEQLRWLDATLADADARGMRTVVAMHMPPFSSGKEDGPVGWVKERVVEGVLDRHRVDLVACGHAHAYERLRRPGLGGRQVDYVVTGGGGAPFHHEDERDARSVAFAAATAHYVLVEMTAERMRVRMVPVVGPGDVPFEGVVDDVVVGLGGPG